VKFSSNEKKMKKQRKVFSIVEKMQMLAKVDAHMETWVDPAVMLGLSVSMLNTVVGKRSEIEKSDSHCGPSFSKEPKPLKASPLEELETIHLAWFKQACAANASTDGPRLKEKAVHVAARLFELQASGWTILRKYTTWYTRLCWEKVPL
jgi:hypothetical protein